MGVLGWDYKRSRQSSRWDVAPAPAEAEPDADQRYDHVVQSRMLP